MRVLAASTLLLPVLVSAISHPATSVSSSSASSIPESVVTEPSQLPVADNSDATDRTPSPILDGWVAIQTIRPSSVEVPSSNPTDSPFDHLDLREIVNAAPAAQATGQTQVSPVTTITQYEQVNGVVKPVQVLYSQAFSAVPDQGQPPQPGTIGLGTIAGKIGVVKTKRAEAAEQTLAARSDNGSGKISGASSALALLVAIAVMVLA